MDMGASCRSCSCSCRFTVLLLVFLTITTTSSAAPMHFSSNPSTNLTLFDSDYFFEMSYHFSYSTYNDWSSCNNISSSFLLIDERKGLYGIFAGIHSAHWFYDMPYAVYFSLYFVIAAENVCLKENNSSMPAYYLSLVAWSDGLIRGGSRGQVVWTANPEKPVTRNACLIFNGSDLRLVDYHDNMGSSPEVVWKTSTGASNVTLGMSFQGNLVLFANNANPPNLHTSVWESFLYPTDTLMVLQVLEKDSTLTVNSSAATNSRNYTMAIQNGRLVLYARIGQLTDHWNSPYGSPYWVWPDSNSSHENISFAAFCWDSAHQLRLYLGSDRSSSSEHSTTEYRGMVSPAFCSTIPNNSRTTMQITGLHQSTNATFATFLRLEADGDVRAYTVDNTTYGNNATWRTFYNIFNSTPCDLPLYCGFHGMCDPQRGNLDGSKYCTCAYGDRDDPKMRFVDASDSKLGCEAENSTVAQLWDIQKISREASICPTIQNISACAANVSRCELQFLSVHNVHYFSLNLRKRVPDKIGCQGECKYDSCCAAAFWNESSGLCFVALGRLGTIKQNGTMQAFIKYVRIRNISSHARSPGFTWKMVGTILAATLLVACIFLIYWRRREAHKLRELEKEHLLLLSHLDCSKIERFTWKQMHEYTCGFSDLLGSGGFGRVFRGALPDGTAIAVKQLAEDGSHGQGDKEFIAEVSILSRIHHAQLVRLIGFCLEGMHRLLVYEYMENGSLDTWLFQRNFHGNTNDVHEENNSREVLEWKARFQIALGTAKGLAYLHEECEERVIHMDLKPQNILLGRGFLAKISDFGMSRRTDREQSSVMTVMRGTPGYLAPEWLLECTITEKCDVYSFGIVLLEMVSGRKVKDLRAVKQKLSMRPLMESVMLELLDENLRHGANVSEKEAVKMVEVALLCVRKDPRKRPSMSSVVLMLEGKEVVLHEDDDDDGQELELAPYPSAMNRTMRMRQQYIKLEMVSFRSLIDSDSGSKKKYMKMDRNQSHSEAAAASIFGRGTSSALEECDRLLQK